MNIPVLERRNGTQKGGAGPKEDHNPDVQTNAEVPCSISFGNVKRYQSNMMRHTHPNMHIPTYYISHAHHTQTQMHTHTTYFCKKKKAT